MQIHYGLDGFKKLANAIVTSGTFDGVHVGHQKILSRLIEVAKQTLNGESVVITFWPHPRIVLFPEQTDLQLLTSLDEKAMLLDAQGIDHLIVLPFSKQFAQTTSHNFIQKILIDQIGTKKLVIGYDHRFGKNREGSFDYLKEHAHEWGLEVEEIPRHDVDNIGVSSTKIRKALIDEANIDTANAYLGHAYMLTGKVVEGEKIGRSIGYPTANIAVSELHKLIPSDGVYAVKVKVKGATYKGMLYIGPRPTIGDELNRTIEVNIFDFDTNIYDEQIRLYFIKKIRGDSKFDSLKALQDQLAIDKTNTQSIFSKES